MSQTSREAWSETHMGDRNDIELIGDQKELIEALAKTGKPMVSVVISGRPLSLTNVEDNLDAILYGWILGQETGTAVADILFGDTNPSGKMPVSVPRSVGNIPAYYNHKPTARRGYAFADASSAVCLWRRHELYGIRLYQNQFSLRPQWGLMRKQAFLLKSQIQV